MADLLNDQPRAQTGNTDTSSLTLRTKFDPFAMITGSPLRPGILCGFPRFFCRSPNPVGLCRVCWTQFVGSLSSWGGRRGAVATLHITPFPRESCSCPQASLFSTPPPSSSPLYFTPQISYWKMPYLTFILSLKVDKFAKIDLIYKLCS